MKVSSSGSEAVVLTIRRELGVEPLLLHIERSQLRWFLWLGSLLGGGPGSEPELTGGIIYPWVYHGSSRGRIKLHAAETLPDVSFNIITRLYCSQ